MPNIPTRETITEQHPNHYSIYESVSCYHCNPYGLTEVQYRRICDEGGNPSEMDESDVLRLQERGISSCCDGETFHNSNCPKVR
jgi:hypothetical protein